MRSVVVRDACASFATLTPLSHLHWHASARWWPVDQAYTLALHGHKASTKAREQIPKVVILQDIRI